MSRTLRMNTETTPQKITPPPPAAPKGFLGSLLERIDRSMKAAADKKSAEGCCGPGDGKGGGKGGKCC
jgi:hypothetical protein